MTKQANPAIEAVIRDDIRQALTLGIDLAAIAGTGAAGQPLGIIGTSGVGTVDATGGILWNDLVEFETDLGVGNALRGRLAYMTRHSVAGALKTTLKASGISGYLMADDGTINGYPAFRTQQVPAGHLIFGNWAELFVGMWGGLDLFPDPYTRGDRGGLVLRGFQDIDIGVRHAASFSIATNIP